MTTSLHIHSSLQGPEFPLNEYRLKIGEMAFEWRKDGRDGIMVLENIPHNDQFVLFLKQFATPVEDQPATWRMDLDTVDKDAFVVQAHATFTRLYVDSMYEAVMPQPKLATLSPPPGPYSEAEEESEDGAATPGSDASHHHAADDGVGTLPMRPAE